MYEIGKRSDGKFNVWHFHQIGQLHGEWIIAEVFDDKQDAQEYIAQRSKSKRRHSK